MSATEREAQRLQDMAEAFRAFRTGSVSPAALAVANRRCQDCDVEWRSSEVHCWNCGAQGVKGHFVIK